RWGNVFTEKSPVHHIVAKVLEDSDSGLVLTLRSRLLVLRFATLDVVLRIVDDRVVSGIEELDAPVRSEVLSVGKRCISTKLHGWNDICWSASSTGHNLNRFLSQADRAVSKMCS